ncbi:MAG: TetR/AcrR family transcriptional regulator [Candidatus Tumulicola sp.]
MSRTADDARRAELLDRAVDYVLEHGLAQLSLRPLAKATGASPRLLLYYFGSKEALVVEIIRRGRTRQRETMAHLKLTSALGPREVTRILWRHFSAPKWQPLMRLFFEIYGLALQDGSRFPGFLASAVDDWLAALETCSTRPGFSRDDARALATVMIAGFRGFLLDLCATHDRARVDRAVDLWLSMLDYASVTKETIDETA